MQLLKKAILLPALILVSHAIYAQRISVSEGNVPADLKNEKSINIEFTYDPMGVGKFDREADYVKAKTEEYNKNEAGRGDEWAKKWVNDRASRFEPRFNEEFSSGSSLTVDSKAKYTIVFHTTFMEPGFNVGVARKRAFINAEAVIVETANRDKVLAKLVIDNSPARSFWGTDFDTGERFAAAYAAAGKKLGKFIIK